MSSTNFSKTKTCNLFLNITNLKFERIQLCKPFAYYFLKLGQKRFLNKLELMITKLPDNSCFFFCKIIFFQHYPSL